MAWLGLRSEQVAVHGAEDLFLLPACQRIHIKNAIWKMSRDREQEAKSKRQFWGFFVFPSWLFVLLSDEWVWTICTALWRLFSVSRCLSLSYQLTSRTGFPLPHLHADETTTRPDKLHFKVSAVHQHAAAACANLGAYMTIDPITAGTTQMASSFILFLQENYAKWVF